MVVGLIIYFFVYLHLLKLSLLYLLRKGQDSNLVVTCIMHLHLNFIMDISIAFEKWRGSLHIWYRPRYVQNLFVILGEINVNIDYFVLLLCIFFSFAWYKITSGKLGPPVLTRKKKIMVEQYNFQHILREEGNQKKKPI